MDETITMILLELLLKNEKKSQNYSVPAQI